MFSFNLVTLQYFSAKCKNFFLYIFLLTDSRFIMLISSRNLIVTMQSACQQAFF